MVSNNIRETLKDIANSPERWTSAAASCDAPTLFGT